MFAAYLFSGGLNIYVESQSQGLRHFIAWSHASSGESSLQVNFRPKISLGWKYRIVPVSSPWVSDDGLYVYIFQFYYLCFQLV